MFRTVVDQATAISPPFDRVQGKNEARIDISWVSVAYRLLDLRLRSVSN
jgi:hypothetical protein